MPNEDAVVDGLVIHMYRLGTGDCFVLKFLKGDDVSFKMLIDCGCWSAGRSFEKIREFLDELLDDVDSEVDALVVTHEHLDHVRGFEAGRAKLTDALTAKRIWMGWPEKDGDAKVEKWKRDHGQKKLALGRASETLSRRVQDPAFESQFLGARKGAEILGLRRNFADVLGDFAALHVDGDYKGSLEGMAVVKQELAEANGANIEYFEPGDLIEGRAGLEGIRIYVLGPPKMFEEVKQEHGEEGGSYPHNKDLAESDLFVSAMNADVTTDTAPLPFSSEWSVELDGTSGSSSESPDVWQRYSDEDEAWRRIDDDWLFSSGLFALRMNSLTNNLSLVLAFEFIESGKVVLFPGDAEFGSWSSWHRIDWSSKVEDLTTEHLLNRVVFYKVAHHLSHNGTARDIGLEMMTSPELAAMATLDYNVISNGWKSTMPNRLILKDLLDRTKGRLMVMNTNQLTYDLEGDVPLEGKIEEHRARMTAEERAAFEDAFDGSSEFYDEYVVR